MDKLAVRSVLEYIAAFLELKGENAAQVRVYQNAARRELAATGRSSTLDELREQIPPGLVEMLGIPGLGVARSEEHTSELQSRRDLVCRLLLEKKKKNSCTPTVGRESASLTRTAG